MPKRISITLLATLMVATVALFAATDVRAFSDSCDPPVETLENLGWQVKLVDVLETDSGLYKWHYEVKQISSGTSSGLNFLAMLIPDCCSDPKIDVDLAQSTLFKEYFEVAQGEPTVNFGVYNEQARVAKGTPDKQIDWYLVTNTNVKTTSTIILKVNRIGVLTFEMAVPGCTSFGAYTPYNEQDVRTIKNVQIKILRAPGTGCGIGLQYSMDGLNWVDVNPETNPPTLNGTHVVNCGGTRGKSGCLQECIFTAAASPGWTYVNLGGTWYKVYIP